MFYNKEIETMPLHELRKLQLQRLKVLADYVYKNSPVYKKKFDEAGVSPSSIKTMEDISLLPFTRKTDLRDNYPFGMFAVPEHKISRLHCSSGTTGKATVVGYTAKDIEIFTEVVARSLAAAGCRPGMKLQNAYGYGLFTGGLGLHYGAEKLGMAVIPISGGVTERQLVLLQDFKPEALCCTPSYALTLSEEMQKRGISMDQINLRYAILGAEPWTETIRQQIEKGLGVKACNIYGLSEVMGPGVSAEDADERETGSYIWEDHFYPEIVDKDTGQPVAEGAYGVLVFTTLTKEAMPVIRYWTNDITNIYYDKSFKRTHVKMGPIRGRSDDMLIIRGVNLFHTQVEDILRDMEGLSSHYQLIVTRESTMDEVEVMVEISLPMAMDLQMTDKTAEEIDKHEMVKYIKGHFSKKIKDIIGLSMKISIVPPGAIPRSEGGKTNRIKDLRKMQ
jgi:phenylacetate-CoA ligase